MSEEDIKDSHVEDSEIKDSKIEESDIKDSQIKDSEIKESHIEDSKITDSKIIGENIQQNRKKSIEDKKQEIKKYFNQTINFLKQKKVINVIIISLFLILLIGSSWVRLQNLPLLKDSTTGEYIPLALDPFYFLRLAETSMELGGLPAYDIMRAGKNIRFMDEILPDVLVFMHKIGNVFSEVSLQYIDVIYPVVFFILGLIVFFFLIYFLTKSKIIALLSSAFLAFIPSYLYRTMAGFSDHEAIGMFAFFLALLCFSLALKFLDKQEKKNKVLIKTVLFGLLVGFTSAFTIASWSGIAKFIFMIIPLSFFLFWLVKLKDLGENKKLINQCLLFYISWIVFSVLFGGIFGFNFSTVLNKFILSSNGLISLFVLGFIIIDYILILKIDHLKFLKKKFRQIYSFVITILLGLIGLRALGKNIFSLIGEVWTRLLHPFGLDRVGLTVAENAQPYLLDWMNQTGKIFFWMFFAGIILIGFEIAKGIEKKKNKIWFGIVWIIMISGILFSRISSTSLLNGTNFISQAFYFIGLILFACYCIWLYFNDNIKIKSELIIIASWMLWMLIAGRGALRLFFVVTPFVCFSVGFFAVKIFDYVRMNKEEVGKMILWAIFFLTILGAAYSLFGFVTSVSNQAKFTGPSANIQWQEAMQWVRNETPDNSIFVHWWDYGYWVQYFGKRPTLADGGHFQGGFRDHMIGRYLLTTQKPETALSFMKTNNVSYLLIDYTDLGKYSAYSKIGSDETGEDRYSWVPIMLLDERQTQETNNKTIYAYSGGGALDEDILYEFEETKIFLPEKKAFILGVILETMKSKNDIILNQPKGVFLYNEKQIRIPLRYVYYDGKLLDFENGLDAVISIIPKVDQTGQGIQINNLGAAIYLSPKVSKSLFAQLYLLDDAFGNYKTLKLAHAEPSPVVTNLNYQGLNLDEFIYYQGFRGPIKIWEVDYPSNIITKEEFSRWSGEWAEFDDLKFVS